MSWWFWIVLPFRMVGMALFGTVIGIYGGRLIWRLVPSWVKAWQRAMEAIDRILPGKP